MLAITSVEDDPAAAVELQRHLRRYAAERGVELAHTSLPDGESLLAGYDGGADLLLLDVELPGLDGVAVARRVREVDRAVGIVFVTASAGHAVAGYEVDALEYVLKPVRYPAPARALDGVAARAATRRQRTVVLDSGAQRLRLDADDVLVLAASGHHVEVRALSGRYGVRGPLKQYEAALAGDGFVRCHHGFLVNLAHVVAVDGLDAALVDGTRVPVGRNRRTDFLAALTDHLAARR
jgi:DNA-binding LytR/AlgR family response regulator